jgi:16S rRNA (adenine1518-N6/adenine1519-N6)-dimethyltransferase
VAREVIGADPAGEAALGRVAFIAGDVLAGPAGLHPAVEDALRSAAVAGLRPKCVSNFPYSVATPLIVRLLERAQVERAFPLARIAGMLQREVAGRLTAREITKEYGAPSALVQSLAQVEIERRVSPRAFYPPPKVESAVVRIAPRADPPDAAAYAALRDLVRAVFQYRRKTVRNALLRGLGLAPGRADDALRRAGVPAEARVEQLSASSLAALAAAAFTGP